MVTDDVFRKDATLKRIQSQKWVSTAIEELSQKVGTLCAHKQQSSTIKLDPLASSIFLLCDEISVAVEVAAASVNVSTVECKELADSITAVHSQTKDEELEVQRLRVVLAMEKKLAERRAQYEALAGIILEEPTVEVSQKGLDDKKKELETVEREVRKIEETRDGMAKEVQLFLHCMSGLDAFSKRITALCQDEEESAMDTST